MPAIIYKNAEGKRLPGVTTVLQNLGWNKQPLMYWAWNEGIEGRNYRDTSEAAADIGTVAHRMVEADLKDLDFDRSNFSVELLDKADNAFIAWLEWKELVNFGLVESEHFLVSEKHQYGGTIDVAAVKKVTVILDLKTSNNVYPDHMIQIAAYGALWNENYPDNPIQGYYLLRLGKEDGSFHYHYWPELKHAWIAFEHLLALHKLKKKIK